MKAGLEMMEAHLGPDSPLVAAALRCGAQGDSVPCQAASAGTPALIAWHGHSFGCACCPPCRPPCCAWCAWCPPRCPCCPLPWRCREHSRLIMSALEGDQQELAEVLYAQVRGGGGWGRVQAVKQTDAQHGTCGRQPGAGGATRAAAGEECICSSPPLSQHRGASSPHDQLRLPSSCAGCAAAHGGGRQLRARGADALPVRYPAGAPQPEAPHTAFFLFFYIC